MTLPGFSLLSIEKQTDAALKSTFLDVIVEGGYIILLFDLGEFYAEMYYASAANQVEKFVTFKSINRLERYLNEIILAPDGISMKNVFDERGIA